MATAPVERVTKQQAMRQGRNHARPATGGNSQAGRQARWRRSARDTFADLDMAVELITNAESGCSKGQDCRLSGHTPERHGTYTWLGRRLDHQSRIPTETIEIWVMTDGNATADLICLE